MPDSNEPHKEKYKPKLNSLTDIYKNPLYSPFATLAATGILLTLASQAYLAAVNNHPLIGLLILLTIYIAYKISQTVWKIQNDYIATVLAKHNLERSTNNNN